MRVRQFTGAVAIIALLGVTACSSEEAGSAVVPGGATSLGEGGVVPDPISSEPALPSASEGPSESTAPIQSSDPAGSTAPVQSSDPAGSTAPVETSGAPGSETPESSAAGGNEYGDEFPTDMCDLMPGDLADGLEKSDGDPQLRCFYSSVKGDFIAVQVYNSPWNVEPEDPDGSGQAEKFDKPEVDGRTAYSWFTSNDSATVAFDVGEGAVYVSYQNEGQPEAENMKVAVSFAQRVSVALQSGGKVDGAVEAPPSTTPAKIPDGERGWPGVVCDVMPAELVESMEALRGYEGDSCRLQQNSADGFTHIYLQKGIALDADDPAGRTGTAVKEESFDGRTAYSWLNDGGQVPTAYVAFSTGERSSAEIRYAIADVKNPVDPEVVRSKAVELAAQLAPKLPQP